MGIIQRVPRLNIRPKHLIKVYAANIGEPIPLLRNATDLVNWFKEGGGATYLNKLTQIGTIQSITITTERGVGFYRTLNAEHLGKIRETYPHLPRYSATVENVVFYKEHLLNAFQATAQGDVFTKSPDNDTSIVPTFNIYNQIAPLILKVEMYEPDPKNKTEDKTRALLLWDCWFAESTIEFAVDEDIFMTQEGSITFAWLISI